MTAAVHALATRNMPVRHCSGIGCRCHEPDDCCGLCPDLDGEAEFRSWMDLLWTQRFTVVGAKVTSRSQPGPGTFVAKNLRIGVSTPTEGQHG